MPIFRTPLQKEWDKIRKQEIAFEIKKQAAGPSKLNTLLENRVPKGLQQKLDAAFEKAFAFVFDKGTGVIGKTYNKSKAEEKFFLNNLQASKSRPKRRAFKAVSKQAGRAGNINLAVSSAAGVGLGVLGIGIPDIVLFVSLVLKSLYQICTSYGVDYTIEREKKFILLVIRGAVATGEEYLQIDREIDYYIRHGEFAAGDDLYQSVKKCSACLSKELLYMKFLQGIPLVGAVGGAYDYVYMKKINSYARIKFHKRYIYSKMHR